MLKINDDIQKSQGLRLEGDQIVLVSPKDGGFPREEGDISKISSHHYKFNNSDPGKVHIMVEAINSSDTVQELLLDFVTDPRENSTYPKSQFYYRLPSGKWIRKHLEEYEPRLVIPLEPGVTRIAGVPYFTYEEYISYIESFNDPRVFKDLAFTDENGAFKIYRLVVTNPGGVRNKMRICFGRANHTNETSGYFMAQGIIEWLLSGDKNANLDNIEWSFYLCPDPKAIYYHYGYDEITNELYDTGKTMADSYTDDWKSRRFHIIQCEHMWNNEHGGIMRGTNIQSLDLESYEYHDPLSADSTDKLTYPELMPTSQIWKEYTSFWPHWFEYGTNNYFHRDGRQWDSKVPGTLMMINEVFYYGKDSGGDLIANIKRQGMEWARATSQVYLRFQERHNYWDDTHPTGPVDITGAKLLKLPEHTLAETMMFIAGNAVRKCNADGGPMVIFKKNYGHGLGMKAGGSVSINIPTGANSFKANAAMDDATDAGSGTLQFIVCVDENEVWRSKPLGRYESQMAHISLSGKGRLTLKAEGPEGALANWGGAKFTVNDPDMSY